MIESLLASKAGLKIKFDFTGTAWKLLAIKGWYYISVPLDISEQIRAARGSKEDKWGRLNTYAEISGNGWQTELWYDTQSNTYLLPLSGGIIKKVKISKGKDFLVSVWV